MNIKRIQTKICIRKYVITFSYETKKGYSRTQQIALKHLNKNDAEIVFKDWSKNVRTMFKVKILDIAEEENNRKYIEL